MATQIFTQASDIWSFAIVLVEIFKNGERRVVTATLRAPRPSLSAVVNSQTTRFSWGEAGMVWRGPIICAVFPHVA